MNSITFEEEIVIVQVTELFWQEIVSVTCCLSFLRMYSNMNLYVRNT